MDRRSLLKGSFAAAAAAFITACTGRTTGGGVGAPSAAAPTAGGAASAAVSASPKPALALTMGGSASTSSVFPYLTAHARLAGKADGAMTINVRETNASAENFQLLASKTIDFGIAIWDAAYDAYKGQNANKDKPYAGVRTLVLDRNTAHLIVVRSDKGINTVYDLKGKPFAPSFQGSAVVTSIHNMLEVLGITTQEFKGNLEDLQNALRDGRIVGYGKSGNGKKADASMIDVSSSTPVKLIGFTKEDAAKILAKYPTYIFTTIPPKTLNNDAPFETIAQYAGYYVDQSMPEETAYRLTKALWTTIESAAKEGNNESAFGRTPDETTQTHGLLPLHPGAARYYKEIGAMK